VIVQAEIYAREGVEACNMPRNTFRCRCNDAEKRIIYLPFCSGDVYRYFQFSNDDYLRFLRAESKRPPLPERHPELFPLRAHGQVPGRLITSKRLALRLHF
jgi:hypothetical protein